MPDPFEALRTPAVRVDPDPRFAARLRSQLRRALSLAEGATMPETPIADHSDAASATPDDAETGLVPYLIVADARRDLDWYVAVFGARRRGDQMAMPDGRIGHAELELSGSVLYLADESPESHVAAPRAGEGATVSLVVHVPDIDRALRRSLEAGAALERAAADHPYGRNAVIRDPFGHRWIVSGAPAASPAPDDGARMRAGDIGYVSLWVRDVERATAFYGAVLGWSFAAGSGAQGRQVEGATPHHGLWGGQEHPGLFLCFVVDDVGQACERVRTAGGQAGTPADEAYGRVARCVDDQGTTFALYQPPGGAPARRGAPNGEHHGDLAYVTLHVRDSATARAFYGAVLGWRFSPGRSEDGWAVEGTWPMTGMGGGHERGVALPMYRVDDIAAAVARVRSAGGTATDPERLPYGLSAQCVDDQGTRFFLGEL